MTDAESEQSQPTRARTDPGPRRPRLRKLHFHLGFWTLLSGALVAAFLVLASMSLTGRVISLPGWVANNVRERINAEMSVGSVSLRRVEFGVTSSGRPRFRLIDVGIKDATGLYLAQLNAVEGGFDLGAALTGQFAPRRVSLQGAQMRLRREADGSFQISLGEATPDTIGNLASVLDEIDKAFTDGVLANTDRVEASELTITLEDARSGRIWQVTDGRLDAAQSDELVDVTLSFDVFNQTVELAHTVISARSAKGSSEASISARFENVAAPDLAAQSPALAFLSVLDAPIAGVLRTSIDGEGNVSELVGTMEVGAGAVSPGANVPPAAFEGGKVYIDYDPSRERLDMIGLEMRSELGTISSDGHFYLADFEDGWPRSLIGQVDLGGAKIDPPDLFSTPLTLDDGISDFRLRFDPFRFEIGQAVVMRGAHRYDVRGEIAAEADGWRVAVDAEVGVVDRDEILALWPSSETSGSREWFVDNVLSGTSEAGHIAFRMAPGGDLDMFGVYQLADTIVQPVDGLPPITVETGYLTQTPTTLTVVAEKGHIEAPDGSVMDLSGTTYHSPDLTETAETDILDLHMKGPLSGTLTILDLELFDVFEGTGYGPDVARGDMTARGLIEIPAASDAEVTLDTTRFRFSGEIRDARSDRLLDDKLVLGNRLEFSADNSAVEVTGPVRVGQAQLTATWRQPIDGSSGETAGISGTVALNDQALNEFGVSLPDSMVQGSGPAAFTLKFPDTGPDILTLTSELRGIGMEIGGTGWSKPAGTPGRLALTARLGDRPEVEKLELEAPGLSATGSVTTVEGGAFGEARFDRVRLGGWLDGPVVVTGRGSKPVALAVTGGTIDLRAAEFGSGGGAGAAGPREPLSLAVDRMIVTDSIRLNNLTADLDMAGGLSGTFTGRIDGGAPVRGTVAPQEAGLAFRVTSSDAGGALRGAGVFSTARGGDLDLILAPVATAGTYEGEFTITSTRVVDAPALAEMLSAVSVVGIIDQLQGEGIGFETVEGRFRMDPDEITLYRSSAVGVSMGISMDGYINTNAGTIDMQGVLSPLYILNALGRIFSPRDGEGLFGFNFNLTGSYDDPTIDVNPLSILTPGAFREIFRRAPPEAPSQ